MRQNGYLMIIGVFPPTPSSRKRTFPSFVAFLETRKLKKARLHKYPHPSVSDALHQKS